MQSYQITPLFSVEGQRLEAIRELKKSPTKMAVVYELEQDRTGRVQYTYEILPLKETRPGQEWPASVGWSGKVRAVVYPWELEVSTVQIINVYNQFN